jgi:ribosome-binding factor A
MRGKGTGDEPHGHRHQRLQALLYEELDALLRGEVSDPRLEDVVFTRVELSVDYRSARVWYGVRKETPPAKPERDQIERALERATGFLRTRVAGALDLKRMPTLRFVYDDASLLPQQEM